MFKFYNVKSLKPSPHSVQARLPEAYKKFVESLKLPPSPVHYIPDTRRYEMNPITQRQFRLEDRAIPLKFPVEADEGIWGGEGVIQGFIKYKVKRRKLPHFWVPKLKKSVVYSEILNKYMSVTVTERTLKLIDENCGFDHYILGTPVQDLKSQLALTLRRKMLFALLDKERYHEDEKKNQEVFEKYEKYKIPREEAEWFGLTMRQAVQKQRLLEEEIIPVPLKHEFRAKLIEELKHAKDGGGTGKIEDTTEKSRYGSFLSNLNPFASKKSEDK